MSTEPDYSALGTAAQPGASNFEALLISLEKDRTALCAHPIYAAVCNLPALRTFMRAHAFAVWDFMTLLKSLQRRLTCVAVPWTQPPDGRAARLSNEIVLAEESDEVAPGQVVSHFQLYLGAMEEVGCATPEICLVHAAVASGVAVGDALAVHRVPQDVQRFVLRTVDIAERGSDVQVAAEFLFGREDPIPTMFSALLETLDGAIAAPSFLVYLHRHVAMDEAEHGPAARTLLTSLCGNDAVQWTHAEVSARAAIRARIELWDALLDRLHAE